MTTVRSMLEGLVREGSFKWVLGNRSSLEEEYEDMGRSPTGKRRWMPELSQIANVVVGRCSRILDFSMDDLRENFERDASDFVKHPSRYARNFLEYCCFRALALSSHISGHLADKHFRLLTFDMMLAWETPAASSEPHLKQDNMESTVGREAFCRIAPAIPAVADVVTSDDLFDVLTISASGRLSFAVYEKYLAGLEKAIKKLKSQSESSLLSSIRLVRNEKILEVDGSVTSQPVLQHVGTTAWPGRLILTDHALYFESYKVVSYDKPMVYDLSEDLRQVVKPELTGPWGTRLFDKAVMYKSSKTNEPVVMEFPELTGHSRRDYWLAIICEILYAHKFIRKFGIKGVERDEVLLKAVLGVLRLQAIQDMSQINPSRRVALLMFSLADQLPGGDLILETLASMMASREMSRANNENSQSGLHSVSALSVLSNLGVSLGSSPITPEAGLLVGELVVGDLSSLERAVKESRSSLKNVQLAQSTVDGVKVQGIDTNLAVMKELLLPAVTLGKYFLFLASWDDPVKSLMFCSITTFIIYRGWIGYTLGTMLIFFAAFMLLTKFLNQGRPVAEVKVIAPPPMNTMEQLLAVQDAISKVEEFVQDGNVVLLKLRALILAVFPQATEKIALVLVLVALIFAFVPTKYIILVAFLEAFTRHSPFRKTSTDRWMRRLREWWFSIPAAPVVLEGAKEDKKKR